MNHHYETPVLEIVNFTPNQLVANMNFSDLKDAAQNGTGGAVQVNPTSEGTSDIYRPYY